MARPRNVLSQGNSGTDKRRIQNENQTTISGKKDLTYERYDIGGFTLLFQDPEKELKWHYTYLSRHIRMTGRFLFVSALFQGLFFLTDLKSNNKFIFFKGSWRLATATSCLILCFLVSTGLIIPSQILLFYIQLLYGGVSLFLHFLGRETLMLWDFLILVYGLCFFMLPKISPLDFIHAFMGSSILTLGYIYVSAFWLEIQQWMLSSVFLIAITVLFMYISYSSERSTRERWLLRDRLHREHIDLQIVASNIQDDMNLAAQLRAASAEATHSYDKYISKHSTSRDRDSRANLQSKNRDGIDVHSSSLSIEKTLAERMNMFFKGLIAWFICMAMGYSFQSVADIKSDVSTKNSEAFALLMHSMGFSVFLLYFTGQIRWLIINGTVGLIMLWIFNESGLDNRWAVISTHSVGYLIIAVVVVSAILVFGGVVLVWSHLLEFVKNILTRYPEVQDDLRQEKVLEQVLLRYLSNVPKTTVLRPTVNAFADEHELYASDEEAGLDNNLVHVHGNSQLLEHPSNHRKCLPLMNNNESDCSLNYLRRYKGDHGSYNSLCDKLSNSASVSPRKLNDDIDVQVEAEVSNKKLMAVLHGQKSNSCFFCLKPNPSFLLPACSGWKPRDQHGSNGEVSGISMCTPYTELALTRETLTLKLNEMSAELQAARDEVKCAQKLSALAQAKQVELKNDNERLTIELMNVNRDIAAKHNADMSRKEKDIQDMIAEHNNQLTEIKRIYKNLQSIQRMKFMQLIEKCSKYNIEDVDPNISFNEIKLPVQKEKKDEFQNIYEKNCCDDCVGSKSDSGNPIEGNFKSNILINDERVSNTETEFQNIDIYQENLCDFENSFDRLWTESLEEIQAILSRGSKVHSAQNCRSPDDNTPSYEPQISRMKYALKLTSDIHDDKFK